MLSLEDFLAERFAVVAPNVLASWAEYARVAARGVDVLAVSWRVGAHGVFLVLRVGVRGPPGEVTPFLGLEWPDFEASHDREPGRGLELARTAGLRAVAEEVRRTVAAESRAGLDVVRLAEESLVRDVMGA